MAGSCIENLVNATPQRLLRCFLYAGSVIQKLLDVLAYSSDDITIQRKIALAKHVLSVS